MLLLLILTGGGSSIQTMSDLAKAVLRLPSRTASLTESPASKMQLKDGSWAVAYGLTIWGHTQGGDMEHQPGGGAGDILKSVWRWFRRFLP